VGGGETFATLYVRFGGSRFEFQSEKSVFTVYRSTRQFIRGKLSSMIVPVFAFYSL